MLVVAILAPSCPEAERSPALGPADRASPVLGWGFDAGFDARPLPLAIGSILGRPVDGPCKPAR